MYTYIYLFISIYICIYINKHIYIDCGSPYRLGRLFNLRTTKNYCYSCLYSIVTYSILCYNEFVKNSTDLLVSQ